MKMERKPMEDWYDKRRVRLSTAELMFLIRMLQQHVDACDEMGIFSKHILDTETDPQKRKELDDYVFKQRRIALVSKDFIRWFKGILRGRRTRLGDIEHIICVVLLKDEEKKSP